MGFDKAALTFKALLVVHEAVHYASQGPVQMTLGLRFALAYLYATGEKDVDQFQRFASCIADPMTCQTTHMGNYMRASQARGHLNAFMIGARIEPSVNNQAELRKAFERLTDQPPASGPDGKQPVKR